MKISKEFKETDFHIVLLPIPIWAIVVGLVVNLNEGLAIPWIAGALCSMLFSSLTSLALTKGSPTKHLIIFIGTLIISIIPTIIIFGLIALLSFFQKCGPYCTL